VLCFLTQSHYKTFFRQLFEVPLWKSNEFFQRAQVLNFDTSADTTYKQLIQNHPHLNKRRLEKDVKIASVAIANQAILVTRNQRDFVLVPGLQIEDWN
jgi:tRNA(fMet)-specific endonuclease VapC